MRLNIRVKLIGGFLIVVGMLLVVALVAYNGLNKVSDGADGINRSAALNDAAMKIRIAALRGMDAESIVLISGYSQGPVDKFNASAEMFDQAEGVLDELGTDHLKVLLEEVVADYEVFQDAVLTTMSLELAVNGSRALLSVNDGVAELFDAANGVVSAVVASPSSSGAALNHAGAQRMRAYKMAFLANDFKVALPAMQPAIADKLSATVAEFEEVRVGLRNGDAGLGLTATTDETVRAQLDALNVVWTPFRDDLAQVIAVGGKHGEAIGNSIDETEPIFRELIGNLDGFEEEVEGLGVTALESAGSAKSSAVTTSIIVAMVAVVVAVGLGFFLSRMIANGVGAMLRAAEGIAEGDLEQSVDVTSKDEIGDMAGAFSRMIVYLKGMAGAATQLAGGDLTVDVTPKSERDALGNAFALMIANLRDLVGKVDDASTGVSGASEQLANAAEQAGQATTGIAQSAQEVAKGAEQQSRSVQETAGTIRELSQAAEQVASRSASQTKSTEEASVIAGQVAQAIIEVSTNAQAATDGARQASDAAATGAEVLRRNVEGMERIRAAVSDASEKIGGLGQQSAEIGKIIAVIDDVAEQTNLLALNAAIEAARAGEQGRGFAVVADEVRKLAERVSGATTEIATLIENVQAGVEESVKATDEGRTQVEEGSQLVMEAGEALNAILVSAQDVAGRIEQISAAAEEVAASSDEMVKVLESVSATTQENSAAAQQMSASTAQVDKAMEGVSAITEQASASSQETSASAEEMSAQVEEVVASAGTLSNMASDLKAVVGAFKLTRDAADHDGLRNAPNPA